MESVAFSDEILGFLSERFPRLLEFLELVGFKRSDHVKSRSVLEFFKVHVSILSGRHRFFLALTQAAS